MEFSAKIRAARAALGWTQEQLAEAAGLSPQSIPNVERGDNAPTARTQEKLIRALQKNGVELTGDGVRLPDATAVHLTGEGWFIDVLDDALQALKKTKDREILIFGSDHRVSPQSVIDGFRKLIAAGVTLREIGKEGNTYIMGDVARFRWVPAAHFKNTVTMIYADKVVTDFGTHGMLIRNADWAQAERHKFELIWSAALTVTGESTADVRY